MTVHPDGGKADEERERAAKEAIQSFLQTFFVPRIRRGQWSMPIPIPEPNHLNINWDWPHWEDLKTAAENFWTKEGWCISKKKQNPFVQMVREAFWDIVLMRGEPGATAGLGTYGIDPHRAQRAGRCCRRSPPRLRPEPPHPWIAVLFLSPGGVPPADVFLSSGQGRCCPEPPDPTPGLAFKYC